MKKKKKKKKARHYYNKKAKYIVKTSTKSLSLPDDCLYGQGVGVSSRENLSIPQHGLPQYEGRKAR